MVDIRVLPKQLAAIKKRYRQGVDPCGSADKGCGKKAMQRKLKYPTLFTVNLVKAAGPTKSNLVVRVFVMDAAGLTSARARWAVFINLVAFHRRHD